MKYTLQLLSLFLLMTSQAHASLMPCAKIYLSDAKKGHYELTAEKNDESAALLRYRLMGDNLWVTHMSTEPWFRGHGLQHDLARDMIARIAHESKISPRSIRLHLTDTNFKATGLTVNTDDLNYETCKKGVAKSPAFKVFSRLGYTVI